MIAVHSLSRRKPLIFFLALLPGCAGDEPTAAPRDPSPVVRGFDPPNGCVPEVTTEYTDSTETIFTTFSTGSSPCIPNLSRWGIDMGDPMAADTPQGNANWGLNSSSVTNLPSPSEAARGGYHTPPQVMIEFDPAVQSVEFHYSRLLQERAVWGGLVVSADSLQVRAMSRTPGTLYYQTYARKVLYSNVQATTPPWSRWDPVKLSARGDKIQWLWFDGSITIDNLRVTRAPLRCTPSVQRGQEVTCEVVSAHMSVTGWEFQPDSIGLPPVQETSTSKVWKGPAVTGGRVTVHVVAEGVARSFKARFEVTDRPWRWADQWEYRDTLMPQPEPPFVNESGKSEITYARNEAAEGRYEPRIMPQVVDPDPARRGYILLQIPPGGPNAGFWYVASMSLHMHRRGRQNPFVMQGAPLNLSLDATLVKECKRHLDGGTMINFYRFNICKRKNVDDFLAGVRAHEGFGRNGGTGHEGLAQQAAALVENDPYRFAEPRVRLTREELDFEIRDEVPWMADRIYKASRDRQDVSDPIGPRGNWSGTIWDWVVNTSPDRFLESSYWEL